MENRFLIRNSYLSKDPKTKRKGYYRDYFYLNRFFEYFLVASIMIWWGTLIYIKPESIIHFGVIIKFYGVYIFLAICFSLDTERVNYKVIKPN